MQRLLRFAGLDPDHALVRWGNFDRTVLLPSTVFEADETGRSYRFRPNMRSIWVRNFPVKGPVKAYFQVPDTPELAELVKGTGAQIVEGSTQTTNSWGLRGPEPDLAAPWRGIVLGDSYMQGLFVGDRRDADRMPEARPQDAAGSPGRDPQHGPPRLLARAVLLHAGRIRRAVPPPVRRGQRLRQRLRRFPGSAPGQGGLGGGELLAGPDPAVLFLPRGRLRLSSRPPGSIRSKGLRWPGNYPGKISNILEVTGPEYLDPIAEFANAQLEIIERGRAAGPAVAGQPALQRTDRRRPFLGAGVRDLGRRGRPPAGSLDRRDASSPTARAVTARDGPAQPEHGSSRRQPIGQRYSPITLTSTRLARRPSNSP